MKTVLIAFSMIGAICLTVSAANAQSGTQGRAWVSGHGSDAAGCGSPTAPCRSFQYTLNNVVAPNGEIDVLDPAGYGAMTISHAVSIVNDGVGTAGVQQSSAGQNAITINAGQTDTVTLRGLNIDGLNVASVGIEIGSVGTITISNCVVRHFAGSAGIRLDASVGTPALFFNDLTVSDNVGVGIDLLPTSAAYLVGLFKRLTVNSNNGGVYVAGGATYGALVTIVDSTAGGNANEGFGAGSASNTALVLDNVASTGNGFGVNAGGQSVVRITRSAFTQNQTGVTVNGTATLESFGDNVIRGNVANTSGTITPVGFQ